MKTIGEKDMLSMLLGAKRVLLLEPTVGTYLPLGLAKIATFVRKNGGQVEYGKSSGDYDLVAVSTLFTYDAETYRKAIAEVGSLTDTPIIVGGICASLSPRLLEPLGTGFFRVDNMLLFQGFSPVLDQCVPDYSIDWGKRDGWEKYSYSFTTRGCPNHCGYCAVPKLEKTGGSVLITPNWRDHIVADRRTCVVMDNNITAAPGNHMEDVVNLLVDREKTVIFENGIDCKHVTPAVAKLLGKVNWAGNGLRIAFDRIEEDGVFQKAVQTLLDHGVGRRKIMSYVLFNFNDTPKDAEYRLLECAKLGVQPYPQRFSPLGQETKGNVYVGKHWTKRLGIAFQHFGIMGKFRVKGTRERLVTFMDFAHLPNIREKFKLSVRDLDALSR